jgi:hypothetical protein
LSITASACSTAPTKKGPPPPATFSKIEGEDLLTRYTYFEIFAAGALLELLANAPNQAEGESAIGCRVPPETARKWSQKLGTTVERSAIKERLSYLESPVSYHRARGFDQCVPNCTCTALVSVVKPVPLRFFQGPELRAIHRGYLRKLEVKTMRQNAQEWRVCLERQTWLCASDLREFLEKSFVE